MMIKAAIGNSGLLTDIFNRKFFIPFFLKDFLCCLKDLFSRFLRFTLLPGKFYFSLIKIYTPVWIKKKFQFTTILNFYFEFLLMMHSV